jgi:hypothetical protein
MEFLRGGVEELAESGVEEGAPICHDDDWFLCDYLLNLELVESPGVSKSQEAHGEKLTNAARP